YAPFGAARSEFFRRLETFLGTSRSLLLLGDWNGILDVRWEYVGACPDRRECDSLKQLVTQFDLIDKYRLENPTGDRYTWSTKNGKSRSYLDRIFIKKLDKDLISCPQAVRFRYTDHKLVTCVIDPGTFHKRGSGYYKLNLSLPINKTYIIQIRYLIKQLLTGAIINNRWWHAYKRTIKKKSIEISKQLATDRNKEEEQLVDRLEEAIKKGDAASVLTAEIALDHFFDAKHEGCIVRCKTRALGNEGVKSVSWARVTEVKNGNKSTIRSLITQEGITTNDPKLMCKAFQQHFTQLFEQGGVPGEDIDFRPYLDDMPRLSVTEVELCEKPITATEIEDALGRCRKRKSPGVDGLPYEFFVNMPDLFSNILEALYVNWLQNGRIPASSTKGIVTLIRKDKNKEDTVQNFRPITLLNTELQILAKVLAKRLAGVIGSLVGDAQTCAVPTRSIHDNLHLMRYILGSKPGFGGALINHRYLKAVLMAAGFGPNFRSWIKAM
ncbi:hypothetical protein Ahia01_000463900, partial [Argonauta hians]